MLWAQFQLSQLLERPLKVFILVKIIVKIWFILVDSFGNSYRGKSLDHVNLPRTADLQDLKKQIKTENNPIMPDIVPSHLRVYKSKDSFTARQDELSPDLEIGTLGAFSNDPLIVLVPRLNLFRNGIEK